MENKRGVDTNANTNFRLMCAFNSSDWLAVDILHASHTRGAGGSITAGWQVYPNEQVYEYSPSLKKYFSWVISTLHLSTLAAEQYRVSPKSGISR